MSILLKYSLINLSDGLDKDEFKRFSLPFNLLNPALNKYDIYASDHSSFLAISAVEKHFLSSSADPYFPSIISPSSDNLNIIPQDNP